MAGKRKKKNWKRRAAKGEEKERETGGYSHRGCTETREAGWSA
jgi:hypothetical protein